MKKFSGPLTAGIIAILLFSAIPAIATPINIGFTNTLGATYTEDRFTFTRINATPKWEIKSGDGFVTNYLNIHDHKGIGGHYLELTYAGGAFGIHDLQFRIDRTDEAPLIISNNLGGSVELDYDANNLSARSYSFDSSWGKVSWVRFDSGHDITIGNINLENPPTPTPEPATMLLLSSGLIGLAGFRRKFRKK